MRNISSRAMSSPPEFVIYLILDGRPSVVAKQKKYEEETRNHDCPDVDRRSQSITVGRRRVMQQNVEIKEVGGSVLSEILELTVLSVILYVCFNFFLIVGVENVDENNNDMRHDVYLEPLNGVKKKLAKVVFIFPVG
jgi:hypothetical protein